MKLLTSLIILALLGFGVFYDLMLKPQNLPAIQQIKPLNSAQVPDIKMTTLSGEEISFYDLDAELILVNFWASWCEPCIKEMPELVDLVARNQGKIVLITVSIDRHKKRITDFMIPFREAKNIYWLWDKNRDISLKTFNTMNIPETIIINQNRQMIKKIIGIINWKNQTIKTLTQ